jgi:hypothetical protein
VHGPHLLFLDPRLEQCVLNCRARLWEPHKYRSSNGQNERLAFLIDWVKDYYVRDDELSRVGHQAFFDA